MVIDSLNVVQAAHPSHLPNGLLESLIEPTQRGQRCLAGVDLQKPRLRALAEALLALAPRPGGFTLAELAQRMRQLLPHRCSTYTTYLASCDLPKRRGEAPAERVEQTRRYPVPPYGIRILAGMLVLRERVIKPVLAPNRLPVVTSVV